MEDRIRVRIREGDLPALMRQIIVDALERQQSIDVITGDESIADVRLVAARPGEVDQQVRECFSQNSDRQLIMLDADGRTATVYSGDGTAQPLGEISTDELVAAITRKPR